MIEQIEIIKNKLEEYKLDHKTHESSIEDDIGAKYLVFVSSHSLKTREKHTKGQLISKCLSGVIVLTKIATKISVLKVFVASWRRPGSFLWLPGDLVSNIIYKEACRKPQKISRKL